MDDEELGAPVPLLEVVLVDDLMPGAAPVTAHSRWESVATATAASTVSVALDGPTVTAERPDTQAYLDGEWRRRALPVGSDEPQASPDIDDRGWDRVMVPDNYGLEPSLSSHHGPVWYRKRIAPPPFLEDGDHVMLSFDAVDYLAEVWLDGERLGGHEGFFAPFRFDVTGKLRPGSVLAVKVEDPFEDLAADGSIFTHAKRHAIKGTLNYHDSRPGGLPGSGFSPGWTAALGQSLSTGGITGSAHVDRCGPVRCDGVFVTPLDADAGRVHVCVVLDNLTGGAIEAEVQFGLEAPGEGSDTVAAVAAIHVGLSPGPTRIDLEATVPDPQPWWPVSHLDLGGPVLYRLDVDVVVDGRVSDYEDALFGLRTAAVEGDSPRKALVVNGRKVFVQAANYIPRQHFAGVDADVYRNDFLLCAAANLNSVGVHAHLQPPPCYDAADEEGILVFQDFPLQWHYEAGSQTNPGFVDRATRQIAEMAYTYWNHPSIVYWACHNEPLAMFTPGRPADAATDPDDQVLDERLEEALRAVERGPGARHVHRASGIGDDLHLYSGSLEGGAVYDVAGRESWFVSELGFWTVGEQASRWGDQIWPPDERGMEDWASRLSFMGATLGFAGIPSRYPSLDAWQYATGAYGSFLAKHQIESMRARRGDPFMAWRWHFFSDWWGWAGGGLVDVDREPKATFHAVSRAARPAIAVATHTATVIEPGTSFDLPVVAINDTRAAWPVRLRWQVIDAAGSTVIAPDPDAMQHAAHAPASDAAIVAMPLPGEDSDDDPDPDDVVAEGLLTLTVEPESAESLGAIPIALPDEPFQSLTVRLAWNVPGEDADAVGTNWFHVLSAPEGWTPGPGAFIVTPTGATRLGLDPDTEEVAHAR